MSLDTLIFNCNLFWITNSSPWFAQSQDLEATPLRWSQHSDKESENSG